MPSVGSKRRVLAGSRDEWGTETPQVLASATATPYPAFPTGPNTDGWLVFAGDMKGAKIRGARWDMTVLTTFTAADAKLQHSPNGTDWSDVDGGVFTQKGVVGSEEIIFTDTDADKAFRFWRVLIDMTGTPGTSSHLVELVFCQPHCGGHLAPPGQYDVNH